MKYFSYGMNTNKSQMAQRCPDAVSLGHAVLYGHEFRFARHADIIENPEFITHGVLWEITAECEQALDALEGYPTYYLKKLVNVFHNGKSVTCMTYYMTGDNPDEYPSDGYLEMLMDGYQEHGVDNTQLYSSLALIQQLDRRELEKQAQYFHLFN
jgi:gamma-glutamylcyclotransferase